MTAGRPRLLVATTIPETAWILMRGQLRHLQRNGFDVVLVSSPGPLLARVGERESIRVREVEMARELALRADAGAFRRMIEVVRSERVDISYVSTPKAGLIAGLAAWISRVPRRIYLLRGLRLETEQGYRRAMLWLVEWIAVHIAHEVVAVSPSLLERAQALRLLGRGRGTVLGSGASNGVDIDRFAPTQENVQRGRQLRSQSGIPPSAFVFGFVGRLALDKGVRELVTALARAQSAGPDMWLLVAGAEDLSGLPHELQVALERLPNVRFTGWLDDVAPAYHAMDCLVLPTYREGFPNVSLEAAAAGRPVITTTATGAVDSIEDGLTGLLVRAGSADDLAAAMARLATEPNLADSLGSNGPAFVARSFTHEIVWGNLLDYLTGPAPHKGSPSQRPADIP